MENFEYSIQLNDRDWAEFYLASEECSLIQPALATADEQLLSDLEEGEAEGSRLIRVRVGPASAPRAPDRHLLAEDILSGSEDETDLGSVSRFLCSNSTLGMALPLSSGTQESRLSHVTLKLPGSQSKPARDCEALCAGKEKELETGDCPMDPDSSLSVVSTAVQEDSIPGQGISEKVTCAEQLKMDTSERIESPAEEKKSAPLRLELQQPKDKVSQSDIQFPTSVDCTAVHENPETPGSTDLAGSPNSACFPSPEPEGAEHPDKNPGPLQVSVMAQVTPFQEQPSLFQGHQVAVTGGLAAAVPLPGSYGEGTLGKESNGGKGVAYLREEGRADPNENLSCNILKEDSQRDQEMSSTTGVGVNLQPFVGLVEYPTLAVDSRCDRMLDKPRETSPWMEGAEKDDGGGPCHHLGMTVPSEEESLSCPPASQGFDFLADPVAYGLAQEDSPESHLTTLTWPEMYDYFFCDDTQLQGAKMQEGMAEECQGPNTDPGVFAMDGPEMYEYFFNEMVRKGSTDKDTELEMVSAAEQQSTPSGASENPDSDTVDSAVAISVPEVYEHFFTNGAKGKRRTWRGVLLSVPVSEAKKAVRALKSVVCKPARLLRSRPTSQGPVLRRASQGRVVCLSPGLLGESQPGPGEPGMAVMIPERPLKLVLSHRDMCLGFVALASWAVKTSDLQAPDAWKILLLANFGTLSAIRYFRKQAIEDRQQGT